ncbi:HDOD domain-containing protein [Desulfonatronum lacustre]|uniref:HDOD domain-containing protein n=1 Tax=Desulfonatronum lacustre TaxID=66849 RepID=UPI00048B2226|nr:HDOD domain-containing protein [Desulfonatronum lacustre]
MAFHTRGQDFLNQIPEIQQDLPVSPQLFQTLFLLTSEQSSSSLVDIAKVVEKDQGLTVRILTMANSAYYGLQSQVGSVHRAVMILGLQEVRKLVLLLNIRSLEQRLDATLFDVSTHWRHQVDVAHAAKIMAGHAPGADPEELFTIGLLHDLGKMITALYRPDDWKAILELRSTKNVPLFMAEDAYWGLDHALIGAMTLKSWFLPASLTEPINWHHAPELAKDFGMQARMIRLADVLVLHQLDHHGRDWPETNLPAKDIRDLQLPEDLEHNLIPEMRASGRTDLFLRGLGIAA